MRTRRTPIAPRGLPRGDSVEMVAAPMTPLIDHIYKTGQSTNPAGEVIPIHSHIVRAQGQMLYDIVKAAPAIRRTLEVGCAYGLSSLHITEALRGRDGALHTIIDPFQRDQWQGIGLHHLALAGVRHFELIE